MNIKYFLLFSAVSWINAESLSKIHVDPQTGHFIDEAGRVRMFRGFNAVNKNPPYYFDIMLNNTIVKELSSLGMNIVRLGNMWNGWQPIGPDSFNESYGKKLEQSIKRFEENGMYTLLDAHQDGLFPITFNGTKDSYWGVPKWIKEKLDVKSRQFPWPMKKYPFKIWPCRYFTDKLSTAFGLFYDNYNETADNFAMFWKYVAKRFKKYKSVIGYELLNEPGPANIFDDKHGTVKVENLFPGIVGERFLTQFYDRLQKEIRKEDDETIIFWEPVPWGNFVDISPKLNTIIDFIVTKFVKKDTFMSLLSQTCGELEIEAGHADNNTINAKLSKALKAASLALKQNGIRSTFLSNKKHSRSNTSRINEDPSILGPGLTVSPGGIAYSNRSAMSWHHYCWALGTSGSNEKYNVYKKIVCDHIVGPIVFNAAITGARRIGGAQMLTEWGLCQPNVNNPKSQNTIECNFVLEEAEKNFVSWIYWDTADTMPGNNTVLLNGDGTVNMETAVFFSRPYPIATAGTPVKLSFDVWRKTFRYEFRGKLDGNHIMNKKFPTEIFVPKIHYPNKQYVVKTSEDITWRLSADNENVLQLYLKPAIFTNRISTKSSFITITPKRAN